MRMQVAGSRSFSAGVGSRASVSLLSHGRCMQVACARRPTQRSQTTVCLAAATATSTALVTVGKRTKTQRSTNSDAQAAILTALNGVRGRGKSGLDDAQRLAIEAAVELLEADGGVSNSTAQPLVLDGRWRLLFTSRPGTASPIQNTFTGVDAFSVFQDVELGDDTPKITNVVDFGPSVGFLRVEALASTDARPLPDWTPRRGAGLPLFGKSNTYPPARPNMRIDFQFDNAAFHFKALPFTIPYPVPFRLLGDETKGWLDVTYTSPDGTFRLSRGNKGTLFVLAKERNAPARSPLAAGTWRLIWSRQADNASPLQKWGSAQADAFQIIDGASGALQNLVRLFGGAVQLSADAECSPASDARTTVFIKDAAFQIGPLRIPVSTPRSASNPGFVDWLFLDDDLRITRGSKGSLFVHTREPDGAV
ncbi:hypothetical protein FOA52_005314 [Chlamydomonas sp. UWO 241]|nr:hypothetical protein FOA52_005314 [Chlamydomonas sp. UWO 241]